MYYIFCILTNELTPHAKCLTVLDAILSFAIIINNQKEKKQERFKNVTQTESLL